MTGFLASLKEDGKQSSVGEPAKAGSPTGWQEGSTCLGLLGLENSPPPLCFCWQQSQPVGEPAGSPTGLMVVGG